MYCYLVFLSFIVFSTARKLDTIEEAFELELGGGNRGKFGFWFVCQIGIGIFVSLVFSVFTSMFVCVCFV